MKKYLVVATTFEVVRQDNMTDKYILEESFGFLTGHTYRAINNRLRLLFQSEGHPITVEQFGVLVHLWEKDGRCQNELADILSKDRPGISRLVRHLEEKGLVERCSDSCDSRKKLIVLTTLGREMEADSKKLAKQVYDECVAGISEEEIMNTKKVLRTIKNKLI